MLMTNMEVTKLFCVLLAFLGVSCVQGIAPSTLRQVNILFRHGDRAPGSIYPTDPYQESAWPQGLSQLTQQGMMHHFQLGTFFRQRYEGFLNESFYNRKEITIRSTDVDRTIQSSQCDMAGLYYPPKDFQVWNADINWQPIPVHTFPKKTDTLLRVDVPCAYYDELMEKTWSSDEVKKIEEDNKDLLQTIQENTEITSYDVMLLRNFWKTIDPFVSERAHNMSFPSWLTEDMYKEMLVLRDLGLYYLFDTRVKQRLRSGFLVQTMTENMKKIIEGTESWEVTPKIYVYSAHDTTAASFLSALNVYTTKAPPFASAVLVELHEMSLDNYVVKVLFKNTTTTNWSADPFVMNLPGCDVNSGTCTFATFQEVNKDLYPVDFNKECKNPDYDSNSAANTTVIILAVILAILSVVIIILVGCLIYYRKHAGYNQANTHV